MIFVTVRNHDNSLCLQFELGRNNERLGGSETQKAQSIAEARDYLRCEGILDERIADFVVEHDRDALHHHVGILLKAPVRKRTRRAAP